MVAVLAAWALAGAAPRLLARASRRALAALALVLRDRRGARPALARAARATRSRSTCRSPTACGCRRGRRAELEAAVRDRRRVPPGEPIYVATRRSDLVTSGHPLLYVLAERAEPDPLRHPGARASSPPRRSSARSSRDLERTRTPLVVRWTDPVTAARRAERRRALERRAAARRLPGAALPRRRGASARSACSSAARREAGRPRAPGAARPAAAGARPRRRRRRSRPAGAGSAGTLKRSAAARHAAGSTASASKASTVSASAAGSLRS